MKKTMKIRDLPESELLWDFGKQLDKILKKNKIDLEKVIVKKVYFGKTKGGKVPMIIEYEEVKCKKNR